MPVPPQGMIQGGAGMGRMVPYGITGPGPMPSQQIQQGMERMPNIQIMPGAPLNLPSVPSNAPKTLPSPSSLPSTSIKEVPGVTKDQGNNEETTIILKKETLPSTGTLPPTGLEIVPGNNGITTKVPEIKSGVPQSIIPPFVNK